MKIALISCEYPPETATGGIATYAAQAAHMLAQRGHHVEVFAGTRRQSISRHEDSILVHRIPFGDVSDFSRAAGPVFAGRHAHVGFDVVEGPEYNADALDAVRLVPAIPLVVRLHTPSFLITRMNLGTISRLTRLRMQMGAWRRGIKPSWHPNYGVERSHVLDADEIVTPSLALGRLVAEAWQIEASRIHPVPNVYRPSPSLLDITTQTHQNTVTFLGRLEKRKGVLDLAHAVPGILRQCPDTIIRFIGQPEPSPKHGLDMRQFLQAKLGAWGDAVQFMDKVPLSDVPRVLSETDLCVFPSLWENFPYVCLESMAAGRGIVASNAGGMAEMLGDGNNGLLVAPHCPNQIAKAVIALLADPERRMTLGASARERVLAAYHPDQIGPLQEASYQRAIESRRREGARQKTA